MFITRTREGFSPALRSMRTTSLHRLNGDRPLGAFGKVTYFACNWLNNLFPHASVDSRLTIRNFQSANLAEAWPRLETGASPSRKLSDLFWMALPWAAIERELGSIHVLDIGCGSGEYGPRLLSWSGHRITSYVGLDVRAHEKWGPLAAANPQLTFMRGDSSDVGASVPPRTNLFISQSAIEHIDDDLLLFERLRDYEQRFSGRVLHVHVCPSAACLKLFLLHGVRHYTPRTLSKITRLYDGNHAAVLFNLGGNACNRLHYEFITRPRFPNRTSDFRDTRTAEYNHRAFDAITQDMNEPTRSPAFYALVVCGNFGRPLF